MPQTQHEPLARGVLDAVLEESRRQAKTLNEMCEALKKGDDVIALAKAREICGLDVSEVAS